MATTYDREPGIEVRIRASRLIMVGVIESIERLERGRAVEDEEEQAIARVAVEQVLRGEKATKSVGIRFIVPRREANRAGYPMKEGLRGVFFLVPDVGPDTRAGTYVAYLRGHYALSGDTFMAPVAATEAKTVRPSRVTLSKLRQLIRERESRDRLEASQLKTFEPELAERLRLPQVTELPDTALGTGAVAARPSSAPPPPRRKR